MIEVTKDELIQMYEVEGLSDNRIAKKLECDRTTVVYMRQRWNIPTRSLTGRQGELLALNELIKRHGKSNVIDMNETDATSTFDILLYENVRIEVKTARRSASRNDFCFTFSNKKENGILEDEITYKLPNGRTIKDLSKSCDFVILVFIDEEINYLILPSDTPGIFDKQSKFFGKKRLAKWSQHFNNWRILERRLKWMIYLRKTALGQKKKKSY